MTHAMPAPDVLLEDESLRDGFQMEHRRFSLEEKRHLFQMLKAAGLRRIQVGAFVHPEIVPQMADTDALIQSLGAQDGAVISALVLNPKGLERALKCGVKHISMSVSVSDSHSRKNAGQPADQALDMMTHLIRRALDSKLQVRAGLQCVFGCVDEGLITETTILSAIEKMLHAGATQINLADTTGMATPRSIRDMIQRCSGAFPETTFSLHLHDTRGLGLANMFSGYEAGVREFDACTGGLGGCPFVKGAAGNVPTEDAVNMFETMGITTGVDLSGLCRAVAFLETLLERKLPGRMARVWEHHQASDTSCAPPQSP
jgi:hydroxymethylglutaryl-CoA lyase